MLVLLAISLVAMEMAVVLLVQLALLALPTVTSLAVSQTSDALMEAVVKLELTVEAMDTAILLVLVQVDPLQPAASFFHLSHLLPAALPCSHSLHPVVHLYL